MELLIYGYGKRVVRHILPAAKKVFNKIYISGRDERKIKKIANDFSCDSVKESEFNSLKNITHIYIGTPENVFIPSIDKIKNFYNKKINLFLETPIIGPIYNYKILKYKSYFKKILIAEDYIYSPIFDCLKELKRNFEIKKIKNLDFINSGYHLHSLSFGFKLSKSKKIIFCNKSKKNYYFKFYDQNVNIFNTGGIDKKIVIDTFNKKITLFHLKKLGEIDIVIDDKILKNKKTFSYDFNKLNLNIKDNDELLRVYSCINMFKNHDNEKLSLLDHNIYTSLIIKFITKFGFFFDVYLLKSSLVKSLFKFVTSNFYK